MKRHYQRYKKLLLQADRSMRRYYQSHHKCEQYRSSLTWSKKPSGNHLLWIISQASLYLTRRPSSDRLLTFSSLFGSDHYNQQGILPYNHRQTVMQILPCTYSDHLPELLHWIGSEFELAQPHDPCQHYPGIWTVFSLSLAFERLVLQFRRSFSYDQIRLPMYIHPFYSDFSLYALFQIQKIMGTIERPIVPILLINTWCESWQARLRSRQSQMLLSRHTLPHSIHHILKSKFPLMQPQTY